MAAGPLDGVRVVELAGIGPAPFAGMLLAELGADVVKVDRPTTPDWGLPPEHDLLNRGRPSVCLDLKHPDGVETVRRLVDRADVFVEGFRPGVCERLGLGPDDLLTRRPALVYGRMTGWGQQGPLAPRAGHDIDYLAVTGILHAIGTRERPVVPLNLLGDFGGGALYLVVGVLAGLLQASRTGRGQVVDAAIVDGATHLSTMIWGMLEAGLWSDRRAANLLDGGTPFYDVFETSDGRHLAVGALEPQFYAELARILGDDGWPERTDVDSWPRLRARLAQVFAGRSLDEWTGAFADSDACVFPVLSMNEAAQHPHLVARGTLVERDGVRQPGPAPRFSATPTTVGRKPARPGAHTRETLVRWGIDDLDRLVEEGIAVQAQERGGRT